MFHKTQITLPWNKYFRQYMMQQEFPQFFCESKLCKQESGQLIKKTVSKDERAWFFSFKEKRAKTVSERIFRAGENPHVFVSTDLILAYSSEA